MLLTSILMSLRLTRHHHHLHRCNGNVRNIRNMSVYANDFKEDFIQNHIPTTYFQKLLLSAGSAAVSLLNPSRPDSIAVFGEASGQDALRYISQKMQENKEGMLILQEKPRINSKTVDLQSLEALPSNTLGHTYIQFLKQNKVTPDSRLTVQFVDDIDLAYVMQRYRESHDLIHTVLGMPTNMLGEVAVKWIEGLQTKLPMCIGGAIFGPLRFSPKQRVKYTQHYLPWAIKTGLEAKFLLNIYWEQRWEQPLDDLLRELNIQPFPKQNMSDYPICFICTTLAKPGFYSIVKGVTKHSNTPFSQCLSQVLGDADCIVIAENDMICENCLYLINEKDRISTILAQHLRRKKFNFDYPIIEIATEFDRKVGEISETDEMEHFE
ncbi:hypothetical protein B566_EDAN002967, partial [Ephemera danica]